MKKKILIISDKASCAFYSSILSKASFSIDTVKVDDLHVNEHYFTKLDVQKIMNINKYDAVLTDKKNYVFNFLLIAYSGLLVLVNNRDKEFQSDTNQILSNIGYWAFENIKKRGRNFKYISFSNQKTRTESPILNRKSEIINFEHKNITKPKHSLDSILISAIKNKKNNYEIFKKIALVITNKNIKQKIKFISSFVTFLSKLFELNNLNNKLELVILSDSYLAPVTFEMKSAQKLNVSYRLFSLKKISNIEIKNTLKILEYDEWFQHKAQYIIDDKISYLADCDYIYIDSNISRQIFSLIPYSLIDVVSCTNILKLTELYFDKKIDVATVMRFISLFQNDLLTEVEIN